MCSVISEAIQYEMPSNSTRIYAFSFPTPACSRKFSSTVCISSIIMRLSGQFIIIISFYEEILNI